MADFVRHHSHDSVEEMKIADTTAAIARIVLKSSAGSPLNFAHFSEKGKELSIADATMAKLDAFQSSRGKPGVPTIELQGGLVPVYDASALDMTDIAVSKEVYADFFERTGCLIVRGVFSEELMERYNKWCEGFLETALRTDANCRHPKQHGKYLINDVLTRLSKDDPDLLLELVANKQLCSFLDNLLGFSRFGSATCHWIQEGGDRQQSHVDYPMHVGSAPFWEKSVEKMLHLTTGHQLNHILPYYSVQCLIASDAMDVRNGSTEVVPCSHLIPDVDALIHDKSVYEAFESRFMNVELQKGDFLIFNRRLIHRGGKNTTSFRRNSLIMQCVWLWGIGQEIIDAAKITAQLERGARYPAMSEEEKKTLQLRLSAPYPLNVKTRT